MKPGAGLFKSPLVRLVIVLGMTGVGAAWLMSRGPMPVVRGTMPLQEMVPLWYNVSAFPVLGILLADLVFLFVSFGFSRKTIELGAQIGVLAVVACLRIALLVPVSGHCMLFACFISRRLLVGAADRRWAAVELGLTLGLFALVSFMKLVQWHDPVTYATGTGLGACLGVLSYAVLKGRR
ncbi:MAG: hypothetical protein ABIJ56_04325 [Pseudomonadota bacterium]